MLFTKITHQRGFFGKIKRISNFHNCRRILDIYRQPLLREVSDIDSDDQHDWISLSETFSDVLGDIQNKICEISSRPATPTQIQCIVTHTGDPGRPAIQISCEMIENLRGLGFTWKKIADILGVSRWTLYRRMRECGVSSASNFSSLTDEELDSKVSGYITRH
jgi:AraC-like DNA-binding protein